jgi:hypothetical protein
MSAPVGAAVRAPGPDRFARHVTASGLAGIASGVLVGGVGGRLFMRVAGAAAPGAARGATTEAGFRVGEITLGGSLGLLFVGFFVGIVGAFLFVAFGPWIAWAGRWQGPVFGLLLFAVGSATSDVLNPDNVDFVILRNEPLLVAMIVTLFIAYGWLHHRLFRTIDGHLPQLTPGRSWLRFAYYDVAAIGLILAALVVPATMFTDATCDCDPPVAAGVFVLLATAGTALVWFGGASRRWTDTAGYLGVGGLAGAAAIGLTRAVADALEILG